MKRRDFLDLVSRAAGGAAALSLTSPAACASEETHFSTWAWVHGGGEVGADEWTRRFERLAAAGVTGVLVGGGDTTTLADLAHGAGLTFHRWIWVLNRTGDDWAKEAHPEWFSVSRKGESSLTTPPYVGYYQWVCPSREPVRDYLRQVVDEVAAHPGVDGVHLDYIRHPDVILPIGLWEKYGLVQDRELPEFDFCYCDVCRTEFEKVSGSDPLSLSDPTANEAWRRFRWDSVTGVVRALADVVHARGKPISAAVFPTPTLARRLVRQAWDEWPLDMVFPMIYHSFYLKDLTWIGEAVRECVVAVPNTPLQAGLYLPDLTPDDLAEAIRLARANGAAGVSVFEMGGLSEPHLAVLGLRSRT